MGAGARSEGDPAGRRPVVTVHARSEHPSGAAAARHLGARARRYLRALGCEGAEVSVLVVGDGAIRRLNRAWRGKDRATDVLSFPAEAGASIAAPARAGRAASPRPLGDVVISLDTAVRAAGRGGRPVEAELDRYLAHGLLHLLGHDHLRREDGRRMAAAEDALVGEGLVSAARPRPGPRTRSSHRDRRAAREAVAAPVRGAGR